MVCWPIEESLFGDNFVADLSKSFHLDSLDAALVIVELGVFKQSNGALVGEHLNPLIRLLHVLPVSSADCERGFSQMNLNHISGRNRMQVDSVKNEL